MMALLGTILFGGALLLVAHVFLDTLLPAMPRIAALLGGERGLNAAMLDTIGKAMQAAHGTASQTRRNRGQPFGGQW